MRRLDASNQHFGASAWMDVWTEMDSVDGFRYHVATEGGSGYIRRHVFLVALDGEQKLWQNHDTDHAALDLTNYELEDGGPAEGLMSIRTKPRRRDILLFEGSIFVKPDADMVRIEGHLSRTPSFWTRHVEIMRRYARIAGVRVPVEFESVAQVLIAGRSTMRMEYEYESVNNTHVDAPQPRTEQQAAR